MLKITINGKSCEAEKGEYILQIARRNGIFIPTFCHHESLFGNGSCRLCVAEVVDNGWTSTVVSCVYPVSKEVEINTDSERLTRIRRRILAMLRNRAPESGEVRALCEMYAVPPNTRYTPRKPESAQELEKCILCGLCVRACAELGAGAILSVGRGTIKRIATPYDEPSADCVGCGSCAAVCPTNAITCVEKIAPDGSAARSVWGKEFALVPCENCGKPFATREELAHAERLAGAAAQNGASVSGGERLPALCETCKRRKVTDVIAHILALVERIIGQPLSAPLCLRVKFSGKLRVTAAV